MTQMIDVSLRVTTPDEGTASKVAEMLARVLVGVSAEAFVEFAVVDVVRYETACDHDHDEVGP